MCSSSKPHKNIERMFMRLNLKSLYINNYSMLVSGTQILKILKRVVKTDPWSQLFPRNVIEHSSNCLQHSI